MAVLNNNAVAEILNTAVAMSTGADEIATLNLEGIIDTGNDESIIGSVESFSKALLNVVISTYFRESLYTSSIKNKFLVDNEEFGAFVQLVSMDFVEAENSHAWQDFTPSSSGVRKQVGVYDVYVPVVQAQIFGHTVSFEIPISISEEQYKTAWHNASEMTTFINYIYMVVQSSINLEIENLEMSNINNFIAEKIAYSESDTANGVHVVNLVELYHDEVDSTVTTANAFLNNANAMRWATGKIDLYSKYFTRVSTLFNTAGRKRFTPKDRQVLLMLSSFETALKTVSYAVTYNPDYVKLDNYDSVAFWQGVTTTDDETVNNLDFDTVSTINVKIGSDGTTVNKSGIVALLCDKYSIFETIKSKRVASKNFDIEGILTTVSQLRIMLANDLTQNAIVFTVNDISITT